MKSSMKFSWSSHLACTDLRFSYAVSLVLWAFVSNQSNAKIAILADEGVSIELPRQQETLMTPKRQTEEVKMTPITPQKPSFLQDEDLLSIPTHFLPPDLQKKQAAIQEQVQKKKSQRATVPPPARPRAAQGKVILRSQKKIQGPGKQSIEVNIEETVWVPPSGSRERVVLQVQRKLPDVEKLEALEISASEQVKKEIDPGEPREMDELFSYGNPKDKDSQQLLEAYQAYRQKDFASAVTIAIKFVNDPKSSASLKERARYVAAHSLIQAGFYNSSLAFLTGLVDGKWRRSAIGMAALAIEKTRDDSAAYSILSKISLAQIPEKYRPIFAFHLGRVLMRDGEADAARTAFEKIDYTSPRFPEAQYFLGVIGSLDIHPKEEAKNWEKENSRIFRVKRHFEDAMVDSGTKEARDLRDLAHLAIARLAYQAGLYHQSIYHYREVKNDSPLARDSLYEMAWSLYRIGEFNRALGALHPLDTSALQGRDYADVWVLRSLNYLKLCRFDEAATTSRTFEKVKNEAVRDLELARNIIAQSSFQRPLDLENPNLPRWVQSVLHDDAITQKDLTREKLLNQERSRLAVLKQNQKVLNPELRELAHDYLERILERRALGLGTALKPFLVSKIKDSIDAYQTQKDRLDYLRYEIYSQASKFPRAIERPQAKKLLAAKEFLPGTYLKGREVLWRFSQEYWQDELFGYDYFIPSECQ